ncbi:MAG TPA: ABC transporter ATP-binding protein, partial [Gammaproteobacteria bacterium]|nr:ABC transporter ATP-binding protein [Gammaproteobacteria bacterium]
YVGGYSDWQRQRRAGGASAPPKEEKTAAKPKPAPAKKLGYKEQRELDALPQRIEDLESELQAVQTTMSDPGFYQGDADTIAATTARLQELEAELARAYERWDELETKRG